MLSKILLTEDQEEQKDNANLAGRGIYSKSRIKARTKQNLWNVKQERPELFNSFQQPQAQPPDPGISVLPGFEACGQQGWLHHPGKGIFMEVDTGRRFWFDSVANEYRALHEGLGPTLVFVGGAATSLGRDPAAAAVASSAPASTGSASATSSSASTCAKQPSPRHIIVPDLHRTAQALKVELEHLDRPAALVAVYGAAPTSRAVATEAAAHALHEKLIRRLAAFRSCWSDEGLCGAVSGSLADIAADHGEEQPLASVALVVGSRVVLVASPGTSSWFVSDVEDASAEAYSSPVCRDLAKTSDEAFCVALSAGKLGLDRAEAAAAATPLLASGRPRAASVALLGAARRRRSVGADDGCANTSDGLGLACIDDGPLVAACLRVGRGIEATASIPGKPQAKRQRTEEAPGKIRVRQILLLHRRGVGPQAVDPVRRKTVSRSPEEAEAQMLRVLEGLTKDGCAGFSNACKATSECPSALKGGELTGDLGWLEKGKSVSAQQANGRTVKAVIPPALLRAAFELEVGQLGDLVSSEIGTHLLLRTA
eukprot:TRINITY_DN43709_c0_g1_i1.p1 TRINITY_DN43709_c0_g1~~TRINITY_DN43709_c0_g1_i1.p1  ORF type:complete len:568 (+),score=109.70 TRINITY_DN43709_c0_g1_i1:84-1706(+)